MLKPPVRLPIISYQNEIMLILVSETPELGFFYSITLKYDINTEMTPPHGHIRLTPVVFIQNVITVFSHFTPQILDAVGFLYK